MSDNSVTAVILAAGEGRRLEPLTNRRPKPMVPVANRPLLEHVVEAVAAAGIDRIALVVGYRQERIRNHFGDGDDWGVTIEYVEQSTQLGTGHAVLQAESVVDGPFVVLNGDRIVDAAVVSQVRDLARDGDHPAMAVTTAEHPREYGVVTLDGDRVTGIDEKPEGRWRRTGSTPASTPSRRPCSTRSARRTRAANWRSRRRSTSSRRRET